MPPQLIKVRPFTLRDQKAVVKLWNDCGLVVPVNDPLQDIRRKLKVQPKLFLVAEKKGRVVGTVMGGFDGHRGWINYLAVDPKLQKSGLGRLLMEKIEIPLRKMGCPKINLQVRESNLEVAAFYERIGYSRDRVISYGKRLVHDQKPARRKRK
jgi:ribosomal protein S18 acetylase RimI-like enzyme